MNNSFSPATRFLLNAATIILLVILGGCRKPEPTIKNPIIDVYYFLYTNDEGKPDKDKKNQEEKTKYDKLIKEQNPSYVVDIHLGSAINDGKRVEADDEDYGNPTPDRPPVVLVILWVEDTNKYRILDSESHPFTINTPNSGPRSYSKRSTPEKTEGIELYLKSYPSNKGDLPVYRGVHRKDGK